MSYSLFSSSDLAHIDSKEVEDLFSGVLSPEGHHHAGSTNTPTSGMKHDSDDIRALCYKELRLIQINRNLKLIATLYLKLKTNSGHAIVL